MVGVDLSVATELLKRALGCIAREEDSVELRRVERWGPTGLVPHKQQAGGTRRGRGRLFVLFCCFAVLRLLFCVCVCVCFDLLWFELTQVELRCVYALVCTWQLPKEESWIANQKSVFGGGAESFPDPRTKKARARISTGMRCCSRYHVFGTTVCTPPRSCVVRSASFKTHFPQAKKQNKSNLVEEPPDLTKEFEPGFGLKCAGFAMVKKRDF